MPLRSLPRGGGLARDRCRFARCRRGLSCDILGYDRPGLRMVQTFCSAGRRDLYVRPVGRKLQVRQEIAVPRKGVARRKRRLEHAGAATGAEPVVEADTNDIVSIVAGR